MYCTCTCTLQLFFSDCLVVTSMLANTTCSMYAKSSIAVAGTLATVLLLSLSLSLPHHSVLTHTQMYTCMYMYMYM